MKKCYAVTLISLTLFLSISFSPLIAANVLYQASLKSFDRKLQQFDKTLMQGAYGNLKWENKLQDKIKRLAKDIKKIEKKWPNEDTAFLSEKLAQHSQEFINKKKLATTKTKVSVKKIESNNPQDKLYNAALKSLSDKFNRFEQLLTQEKYTDKNWLKKVDNKKNQLQKSITKLEKNWSKRDIKPLWLKFEAIEHEITRKYQLAQQQSKNNPVVVDKTAKYKNELKRIKAKFERLDSYMKQEGYGESTWDKNLKQHVNSLISSIKIIEKDLPQKAKNYQSNLKQRLNKIKIKNQLAHEKSKAQLVEKKHRSKPAQKAVEIKNTTASTATQVENKSLFNQVKKEQENYIKNGKIEVWDSSTGNLKKKVGDSAYLSFSSDYMNTSENKILFSGKDFIYAHLNLPKAITEMLPDATAKGLQYYRVTIKATVVNSNSKYASDKSQKNSNKLQRKADFTLAYSSKKLSIAIVPEKSFFEEILNKYRTGQKFADKKAEEKALRDLLSRNFSRQISLLFKKLAVGTHQVAMEFEVTAKLSQEKYISLKNIKGTFLLNVDQEAKERYKNTFDMLTKLYRTYESQHNIAKLGLNQDAEKKRIANMSPREQERYNLAKNSPTGYMAAYGGKRAEISIRFDDVRKKTAYLDIIWPKGACKKCEAGTSSVMITKRSAKKLKIPLGAKLSLNGRTLINSVSTKKSVVLYWYF